MNNSNKNKLSKKISIDEEVSELIKLIDYLNSSIKTTKLLISLLSRPNPSYLYILEKRNEFFDKWSDLQMEQINNMMDETITEQNNILKNLRKNLFSMQKLYNDMSCYVITDKNGTRSVNHKNFKKNFEKIISLEDNYVDVIAPSELKLTSDIGKNFVNSIKKFDIFYNECIKKLDN